MEEVTFTNARGESVSFSYDDDEHTLLTLDGRGGMEASIQTQRFPYQDGSTYLDSQLENRSMTLSFILRNQYPTELLRERQRVSRIFSPKLGLGTLRYTTEGVTREIEAVAEGSPFFPTGSGNETRTLQRASVDLLAPNPYWKEPESVPHPLQAYVGNFTLPFSLPFELGVEGDRTKLINKGDVPAPVQIDIHGPATRPKITNHTTGQFIQLNTVIAADEIAHIDTTPGQKRVEIYRGNMMRRAFGYLSQDSNFWMLEVGENDVEYIADAGNKYALVNVTWNNQYIGI